MARSTASTAAAATTAVAARTATPGHSPIPPVAVAAKGPEQTQGGGRLERQIGRLRVTKAGEEATKVHICLGVAACEREGWRRVVAPATAAAAAVTATAVAVTAVDVMAAGINTVTGAASPAGHGRWRRG